MSYRLETVNLTGGLVGLRAHALRDDPDAAAATPGANRPVCEAASTAGSDAP